MTVKYMKTTQETKAGTYRMWRSRGCVIVSLEPKIGGEDLVGWKHTVGELSNNGDNDWRSRKVHFHRTTENGSWERKAEGDEFYASSTPSALKTFVALYDQFFIRTLLEYEGKVFNPITNETRVHYGFELSGRDEPLQETWIRISDDEEALARIWSDEFKKLAGAILPVKAWNNHDKCTERPQRNIWATIDRVHTAPLGMTTGVGLPPHLWTIIDPDTEKAVPIIDPADEDVAIEKEYHELVERNEAIDRMNAAHEARSADPAPQRFQMFKTYTNWPHANATCKVIAVSDDEVRVEVKNSNGNIVRRWAAVQERTHMDTVCIVVDVEPFYTPCFNACDVMGVDA